MTVDTLELRLASAVQRFQTLQRRAESHRDSATVMQNALAELGMALETLRIAQERIVDDRRRLSDLQAELTAQREKYWALFNEMPEAYIVSRPDTTILEVNRVAAELFNVSQRFLVGKPLSVFVCEGRLQFLAESTRVAQDGRPASLTLKLRPRERAPLTIDAIVKGDNGSLQWILKTAGMSHAAAS